MAVGCRAWMSVVAGSADHEGLASPLGHELRPRGLWPSRLGEVGELADLVHLHLGPCARTARSGPRRSRWISSLLRRVRRGGEAVDEDRLLLPFERDPAEPWRPAASCPARSTLASKQVRGPCGVAMVALYLRAIFDTVEWCLAARVLSIEVSMTQCSRFSRQTSPASR